MHSPGHSVNVVGRTGIEPETSCLSSASRPTKPTELLGRKKRFDELPSLSRFELLLSFHCLFLRLKLLVINYIPWLVSGSPAVILGMIMACQPGLKIRGESYVNFIILLRV